MRRNHERGLAAQREAMAAYMPYSVLLTQSRISEASIVTRAGHKAIPFPEEPRTPEVLVWLEAGQNKTSIWVCNHKNQVIEKVTLPYRPKAAGARGRLAKSGWLAVKNVPRRIDLALAGRLGYVRVEVEHKAVQVAPTDRGRAALVAQRKAEQWALEELVRSALIVARNGEVGVYDAQGKFFRLRHGGLLCSKQDVIGTPHGDGAVQGR
jgi:hypothetical protein